MDWWDVAIAGVKVLVIFGLLLVVVLLLVWAERKIVADMQNRIGPSRAGPWGMLQTLADGLKLFFKEPITPRKAEFGMYILAPVIALVPAFLIFMVIPIGRSFTVTLGGVERTISLQGTDLNIGLLYILAFSSIAVYAIVMAGWSSGSKYPLLGSVRATAQAISYEAAMGLALVPVVFYSGSLSIQKIVASQSGSFADLFGWPVLMVIPRWNIIPMFISFAIFFIAGVAETNRAPFDMVEAEQELVGGFHTEYSSIRFAFFFLAEYINMFNMSAITTTLFLGGWNGPTLDGRIPVWISALLPIVYFFVKTLVVLFVFMWIRATLPRIRYDRLMVLGWKGLIPAALAWLVFVTIVVGIRQFGLPWA
ncbi:NADH-quinone oxidoreductase subunit H [bacterium BMS3Abin02]|nr:NADH-quinone oxidoreductase subunit H [bacterium BMS3Abin02]GBE22187.1 NADH-quinone oxidoreductase subunit H [bacterium BMS3Bbin01]HDH24908.1 NADH-quinone oxidoreductase subunit NuoH [Actinomycetota bacterium]HDL50220.1 NADH-quinone oxidoreductase subunit NuoH [Actinomycetota bacterium]